MVGEREAALVEEATDRDDKELQPEEEAEEPAEFLVPCLHRRLLRQSLFEVSVSCRAEDDEDEE